MRERVGKAARLVLFTVICTLSIHVVFAGPPQATFTASMVPNTAGSLSVRLDAASSVDAEGNVVLHQWVFGDGTTGSGEAVVHTYPRSGVYSVTLFVADDQGETTRIIEEIDVPISSFEEVSSADSGQSFIPPMHPAAGQSVGTAVGQLAPDFALDALGGERFVLSEARGTIVVLDFWSSGCGACQATMPGFVGMQQQLASSNIQFVGISLDRTRSSATRYIERYGFEGHTLWESASANRSVMTRYGVTSVPTTLLIDASGVIRFRGYRSELTLSLVQGIVLSGDDMAIRTGVRDEDLGHGPRAEGG